MKKIIFVLIILVTSTAVFSQVEYGIYFKTGVSNISNTTRFNAEYSFSGDFGFFTDFEVINEHYFVGTGIHMQLIKGFETDEGDYEDPFTGFNYTWYQEEKVLISYLAIPVDFGFKIKSFKFYTGLQASILMTSKQKSVYETIFDGKDFVNTEVINPQIDEYDFGWRIGAAYNLLDNIAFTLDFYQGLNNIILAGDNGVAKISQATAGISVTL
ncbi:MAG: PorT family protein [Flavobacteriales bacterium]|nr:PorT family protein [Flavobacteriales bacterium]